MLCAYLALLQCMILGNAILCRPLLLCVGLREHSLDAMRIIIGEVLAHPLW